MIMSIIEAALGTEAMLGVEAVFGTGVKLGTGLAEIGTWLGVVMGVCLGAVLGSFVCCQAWRIRYKTEGKKELGKRSVCLKCGRKLRWYENIPIISYILQRGKCRGCGEKIGKAEIVSEIIGAVFLGILGYKYARGGYMNWGGLGEGVYREI